MTPTKKRKPRLTAKAIEDLRAVRNVAYVAAERAINSGQVAGGNAIYRGLDWLERFLEAAESRKAEQ